MKILQDKTYYEYYAKDRLIQIGLFVEGDLTKCERPDWIGLNKDIGIEVVRAIYENEEELVAVNELKENLKKTDSCNSLAALRGIEGISSRIYFSIFGLHIKPEWAEFKNRSKNPPKSNVNAVLSFLYSLLEYEVTFAAQTKGLDVMIGSLHELYYGRNSLTYDLMEEFRAPIADTLCCYLFNDNILSEEDFEEREGGIYLIKTGLKKVVAAFEEKLEKSIKYGEKYFTYRELIFNQSEKYKKMIMKEEEIYVPFKFK